MFGNDELLEKYQTEFNKVADALKEKNLDIKFGKVSIDIVKWMVNEYRIWPCPMIKYFTIRDKVKENAFSYTNEIVAEDIIAWVE